MRQSMIGDQGGPFTPTYARLGSRILAFMLDALVLAGVGLVVSYALGFPFGMLIVGGPTEEQKELLMRQRVIANGAMVVLSWPYFTLMECSPWRATLGKRALRIIVTGVDGERIGFGRANARFWSKMLSWPPFFVGFWWAAISKRRQALHDRIAGTFVMNGFVVRRNNSKA